MSEKLTVAELMARNAKDGARRADRPRRRRNLDDGGVSVSELTGSIPVVNDEDLDAAGDGSDSTARADRADAAPVADEHPHRGGHELEDDPAGDVTEEKVDEVDVVDGEVVDEELHDEPVEEPAAEPAAEPARGGLFSAGETTVIPRVDPSAGDAAEEPAEDSAEDSVENSTDEVAQDDEHVDESVDESAGEAAVAPEPAHEPAAEAEEHDPDKIVEYEDDAISWPALLGQTAIALVVGVVIFFGFTLLWDKLPTALVLAMAGVVTLVCVGVVHALLRHRHTLVLILAFIVGLVITLGPRLIMSV
ncbi:hypothetical protein [Corynebacterium sp.]|uniref:hypothetical protein n=1 Tax=Corynebacterium sp. TaxID=1720 RepID=UPI002647CD9C|nr:hypothetical protein [Corynebacterium sp.]MDN5719062.1 hypothetical protein [Corynebacterium sp.]